MTNLWATAAGRAATKIAVYSLIRRRMKRFFKRNLVVQYDAWIQSGKTAFSFINLLGDLNTHHDTEILNWYELLTTIGELPETVADLDLYVNNVTGDDINGLGNSTTPFASVSRALEAIENTIINHAVTIRVANITAGVLTTYVDDEWYIPHDIREGSLDIVGVGVALETFANQDLTAYAALGSGGHQWDVAGAPWVANTWQGSFMQPIDGPALDRAFSIQQNAVGTLISHHYATIPGPPDVVRGVAPPVVVELNKVSIKTRGPEIVTATGLGSKFTLTNLQLDFTGSTLAEGQFACETEEQRLFLDFVSMRFKNATTSNLHIKNARVNEFAPTNGNLEAISASGIDKVGSLLGPGFVCFRETVGLGDAAMALVDSSTVYRMTLTENIEGEANGPARIFSCALGGGTALYVPLWYFVECMVSNNGAVDAINFHMGDLKFVSSYIQAGNNGINAANARVFLADMVCDPAIVRFGMEAGPNVFIEAGDALAVFVGTLGALNFTAPNPDVVVAWPGAGALVDDTLITAWAVLAD